MSSPSTPDLPNLSQPCLYAWLASSKVQSACGALPVVADIEKCICEGFNLESIATYCAKDDKSKWETAYLQAVDQSKLYCGEVKLAVPTHTVEPLPKNITQWLQGNFGAPATSAITTAALATATRTTIVPTGSPVVKPAGQSGDTSTSSTPEQKASAGNSRNRGLLTLSAFMGFLLF
ncbi:hypothetical protein BCR33DRAFT_723434 [Rhizoclosmatium globosum]|uniref:Uncharacterized protein n=1 Tax=Rhizoclosmatium globosum TaxID=329046 RepID=A0A1Y2BC32_9FUNG|nr:hypothetical protein BCR33DRAFT_723434 [Rhizoclosmatium globosum]|eukprot:ORY32392.1 hypothetical protein BCR33DRAFT_723434 [Rhizoclosmatium globosum]